MHIKSCCGFGPQPSQLPAAFLRAVWCWSEKHCRVLGFLQHYETEVKREVSMYLEGCVFILTLSHCGELRFASSPPRLVLVKSNALL